MAQHSRKADMFAAMLDEAALGDESLRLCQALLQIDTTNPPGRERPAADLLATELAAAGLEPKVFESAPGRGSVVARLRGTGAEPPLLLSAHLDVVESDAASWTHPPFAGTITDGFLWGRGAVDMKNMAAMSVALVCALARRGARLRRDLIFAGVADEEAGSDHGAAWLCDHHPDLVRAEYGLGEVGGFTLYLGGAKLYPVQVAEKGYAWLRARVRGEPGHGSMPRADSSVLKLAAALTRLGHAALPPHPTAVVTAFVEAATRRARYLRPLLSRLLSPRLAPLVLRMLPDRGVARALGAMLANTAAPTVLRAGSKTNVIPGLAEAEIDGRTLPGQSTTDLLRELSQILGPEVELEVMRQAPPLVTEPMRSPLFETISEVIAARDPGAIVVPYLTPGFTDGKCFSRLGTKWVGFTPVQLPRGLRFADLYHGNDERIPVAGLRWGAATLADVVCRTTGASM
jgi:acetylornithine deacetylase/succinyl-diaminopimelate desuccinylase-like protein